jgi:hypothetical protein
VLSRTWRRGTTGGIEAALRGLFLRYGCRHGGCGTYTAVLTDRDVEAMELTDDETGVVSLAPVSLA